MNSFDELLKQLLPQQKPVYQPSAVNQLTAPKPQAEVTAYEPTLRQRGQQAVQGLLENIGYDRGYSRGVSQSLLGGPSSTLPMDMGLADVVPGLGYLLGAEESMQGVKSAKKNLDEGNIGSAALEYGLSGLGLLPGIAGTYRPSTPKNIDPDVGKIYDTEFLGGLLDKKPVNLENYLGSSVMVMPWDSTSRNVAVKSVSDVDLPTTEITHGGFPYAMDIQHQKEGIAGASGEEIAKRIQTREDFARQENLAAGGTGRIIHVPITMGDFAENFSVQPTNILLGIFDQSKPTKEAIKTVNKKIRNKPEYKKIGDEIKTIYPYKNFAGIETERGRNQLYTGDGIATTAGNLRKAFTEKMYLTGSQKAFGFNKEDIVNAITYEPLKGVPKGYVGDTLIGSSPNGMALSRSTNPTYDTNFSGEYLGTLGQSIPVEQLMPKTFNRVAQEMANKRGNLRQNTIGALEKRNENVSEFIDDEFLQNLSNYFKSIRQ
jgi:hypothetical protein